MLVLKADGGHVEATIHDPTSGRTTPVRTGQNAGTSPDADPNTAFNWGFLVVRGGPDQPAPLSLVSLEGIQARI